jgi:putative RNA 2'-phosphotransferase
MDRYLRLSKYLSKYLRHRPGELGLELAPGGWVSVEVLLAASARRGFPISREELEEVVARNDKKRFAFDRSGSMIRAQQGHSVPIDLGLEPAEPPPTLYHGTPERNLPKILHDGFRKMSRHHVHLSPDEKTAAAVGRSCSPWTRAMCRDGWEFYRSGNGVWLVEHVPTRYLRRL